MRPNECATLCCVILALGAATPGCGPRGRFVWASELSGAQLSLPHPGGYRIVAGDLIWVRVLNQDAVSTRAHVRADGRFTLPLVGDVAVAGLTPAELASELEARFKPFILAASVSVLVEEGQPTRVSVVGEVTHSGSYVATTDAGVLEALALAGGPNEFACRSCIFVVRNEGDQIVRIRFTYDRLARGELPDARFALRSGDTVVVE